MPWREKVFKDSISSTRRRQSRKASPLNSSVHETKYLITYSINGTRTHEEKNHHNIEQKQELLARESISRPALDYSEGMTAEEQKRYINYLAERVREADLGLRARDAVLQDFLDKQKGYLDKQKEYEERLSKLDVVLSDVEDLKKCLASEVKKRKAAERKAADLEAKLKFANKNRFGDKSHRSKKKSPEEESDRTQDKDDFDGTSSSLPENSMANKGSGASASLFDNPAQCDAPLRQ